MATYRCARSLDTLLDQINRAYPRRSKDSDGWIGDAKHASRESDHNPWVRLPGDSRGIVTARDFTHDPANGFDAYALAERLRVSGDPRRKYIIANGRYCSIKTGWAWRTYTGPNAHRTHIHVSVVPDARCDDTSPWSGVTGSSPQGRQGEAELDSTERKMLEEAHAWSRDLWRIFVDNRARGHNEHIRGDHDLATPILNINGAIGPIYGWVAHMAVQVAELSGRPAPTPAEIAQLVTASVNQVVREAVPAAVATLDTDGLDEEAMADAVVRELVERLSVNQGPASI